MARTKKIKSPTQIELIEPVFIALRSLGGSANISEIRDKVIEMLQLSDEIVDEPHTKPFLRIMIITYLNFFALTLSLREILVEKRKMGPFSLISDLP